MAKKRLPKKNQATYENYKRQYLTTREEFKRRGEVMFDNVMLSKVEWEANYKSWENTYNREIRQGKREKMPDINKKIVSQQTYEYSEKQAKALQQELRLRGQTERTIREIRLGKVDNRLADEFFNDLSQEYYTLTGSLGKNGAAMAISQKYFGST